MDQELTQKFADLKEDETLNLVRQRIDSGVDPQVILKACQNAMAIIGEKFEAEIYFVSDLMMAGQIFKQINELMLPLFKGDSAASAAGKVVIGTVAGDIHDIGKDLVVGILEANNYEVFDLGVDQKKEAFIQKLKETDAPVLALSGLLTIAYDSMKETIAALEEESLREKVKVMIGGGPVNQKVCDFTGADAWGNNAQTAVKLCKQWIGS